MFFPKGNRTDCLSLYLSVADALALGDTWSRRASFTMTLVSRLGTSKNVVKGTARLVNSGAQIIPRFIASSPPVALSLSFEFVSGSHR